VFCSQMKCWILCQMYRTLTITVCTFLLDEFELCLTIHEAMSILCCILLLATRHSVEDNATIFCIRNNHCLEVQKGWRRKDHKLVSTIFTTSWPVRSLNQIYKCIIYVYCLLFLYGWMIPSICSFPKFVLILYMLIGCTYTHWCNVLVTSLFQATMWIIISLVSQVSTFIFFH